MTTGTRDFLKSYTLLALLVGMMVVFGAKWVTNTIGKPEYEEWAIPVLMVLLVIVAITTWRSQSRFLDEQRMHNYAALLLGYLIDAHYRNEGSMSSRDIQLYLGNMLRRAPNSAIYQVISDFREKYIEATRAENKLNAEEIAAALNTWRIVVNQEMHLDI